MVRERKDWCTVRQKEIDYELIGERLLSGEYCRETIGGMIEERLVQAEGERKRLHNCRGEIGGWGGREEKIARLVGERLVTGEVERKRLLDWQERDQ